MLNPTVLTVFSPKPSDGEGPLYPLIFIQSHYTGVLKRDAHDVFFAVQALETSDFEDNWAYHSIRFLTSKTGITRAIAGPLQAREVGNVPAQRDRSPLRGRTRWGTAAAWRRKRSRDAPLSTVRISEACCACAVSSYLGLPRIWWIKHCQRWLSFPCMRPLFPHNWRTTTISPMKIAFCTGSPLGPKWRWRTHETHDVWRLLAKVELLMCIPRIGSVLDNQYTTPIMIISACSLYSWEIHILYNLWNQLMSYNS